MRPPNRSGRRTSSSSWPTISAGATWAATAIRRSRRRTSTASPARGRCSRSSTSTARSARPAAARSSPGSIPARHRIHGHYATPEQNAARGMTSGSIRTCPTSRRCSSRPATPRPTSASGTWASKSGGAAARRTTASTSSARARRGGADGPSRRSVLPGQSTALFVDEALEFIETHTRAAVLRAALDAGAARHAQPDRRADAAVRAAAARRAELPARSRGRDLLRVGHRSRHADRPAAGRDWRSWAWPTTRWSSSPATTGRRTSTSATPATAASAAPGPFRGRKRSLYEGGVRVPLHRPLARPRAGRARRRHHRSSPASTCCRRVCKLAGVEVPAGPRARRRGRERHPAGQVAAAHDAAAAGSGGSASPARSFTTARCWPSATATGSC